jgi:hypothetical protein
VTAETVRIPQPLNAVGVVSNDVGARQLSLRLSELESGHGQLLWRHAIYALVAAEGSGGSHRAVWASAPGSDRVAFAVPDNGTLLFRFSAGEQAYRFAAS